MSAFADAFKLIDGEANAFTLLPAINQGYIYWKISDPSLTQAAFVLGSVLVSAVAFNIITHGDFHQDGPGSKTMERKYATSIIVIAGIWVMSLAFSLIQLYERFSLSEFWPALLSAISLLFVFLLITHIILSWALPMYSSD